MHPPKLGFQWRLATLPLLPVTLWLLMHGYHGLTEDGQIYAFQAFARIHPPLATDLYLQNTSQDQFTLFSPLYAWCIAALGLENAARLLTLVFTIWFLAAGWSFARSVNSRESAWLAVAFLLIVTGDYGGSGVFRILDPFLTARLPAEALIVTALCCHIRGMKRLGLSLALGSMLIHPLMALPGLLLLVCLWVPPRAGVIGAIGCVFSTLVIAIVAANLPTGSHILTVMDAPWLDVVRERSQFLFLQLWSIHDWDINAQPFISLGLTAIVATDDRIRKLCAAAALVGAAGLAVALIGGLIGPVANLVQGQAWRWVWITAFLGAALVPATVLRVWRDEKCGPLCALLLVSGWTLPGIDGTACVITALILWLTRAQISSRLTTHFRWVSAALGVAIVVWISMKLWTIAWPPTHPLGRSHLRMVQLQDVFSLRIPAVLLGVLVWHGTTDRRTTWLPMLISMLLIALSICAFPGAFKQPRTLAAAADIQEFQDWANVIPPTSTVFVAPPQDVGAFVWFTLGRPNYLTLNQSSGVVFSRATALEVQRRSEVLLPLMNPDWKIRTDLRAKSGGRRKNESATRPLTAQNLIQVCADPQLGFVIAQERVGFEPLRHEHDGVWKGWNLYDCGRVRSAPSAT
jgi:hypothetical protein